MIDEDFELFKGVPEDSGYRFEVSFKDLHIMRQWDITQQVVINDDIGYMRYLASSFPAAMKEYLIGFFNLLSRAIEDA